MTVRTRALRCAVFLCAVCLLDAPAQAAFDVSPVDARAAAMLTPGVELAGPPEPHRVTVFAGEYYGVPEARVWGAATSSLVGTAYLGLELSRLGSELYEERSLCVSIGLDAGHDLRVDARVRGLGLAAAGVDDRWTAALDVGTTRRLFGRIILSASCENLTSSRIGDSPVAARTSFAAALDLRSALIQWTLVLEDEFTPSTVLGIEAALTDWLRVRAGARDAPAKLGLGVGFGPARGHPWPIIDVACQWHPRLGVSSFVSVTFKR